MLTSFPLLLVVLALISSTSSLPTPKHDIVHVPKSAFADFTNVKFVAFGRYVRWAAVELNHRHPRISWKADHTVEPSIFDLQSDKY
jgi:hypothetical protein